MIDGTSDNSGRKPTGDFEQFCERYQLDPTSVDAEAQWLESRRQLSRLEAAADRGFLFREQPSINGGDKCCLTSKSK